MGSVLHKATDFVGLTDYSGQEAARNDARAASERSYQLTDEQLKFQREQYDDWKDIYGPLQEDLGTYYKNLTGDSLVAQKVQAIQMESQRAQTNIDQQLAQRGLNTSGIQAKSIMQNQLATAQQKASAEASGDQMAAQQKMQFLGLGLGQGTDMLGINANVANAGANSAVGISNSALNSSTTLSRTNQDTMGTLWGSTGLL